MKKILGQFKAVEALLASLHSGRFAHAWIFAGPRGVGKFTTAIELARILLDPDTASDGALDSASETARLINAGIHPDLHIVRKELARFSDDASLRRKLLTNIPIDVLREHVIGGMVGGRFQEAPAYRTSIRGHGKVFIIDEAELLDKDGQGSLLKTLEEPPPGTYFILVTSRPHRLFPTIHSRCRHVAFRPLDLTAMNQWFDAAGLEMTGPEKEWIRDFAQGSPGMATIAAEYDFHQWHLALAPMLDQLARGVFPAELGATMASLIEAFATDWVKRNHNASKRSANNDGARFLFTILAAHANRQLRAAVEQDTPPDAILKAIDLIAEAERQLWANVNLKQVLENLAVQWTQAREALAISH
jgi:DNA polymerase-3 subunit delta'